MFKCHSIRSSLNQLVVGSIPTRPTIYPIRRHALKRRGAGAPARSEEPQPPMQQNSPSRLRTEHDVWNIKPVRYARKVTVGRGLYLLVTPKGGRCWHYRFFYAGQTQKVAFGNVPSELCDSESANGVTGATISASVRSLIPTEHITTTNADQNLWPYVGIDHTGALVGEVLSLFVPRKPIAARQERRSAERLYTDGRASRTRRRCGYRGQLRICPCLGNGLHRPAEPR
jgi:hypothetical protein